MRPIKIPSFVYRQDGHELSYSIVQEIIHEIVQTVKGHTR